MNPRVSVLMSVYNGAEYLPRAVESILQQEYEGFEFIIVNDGSKDRSAEIIDAYAARDSRIRVFHQENLGLGKALNRAASEARGEYFARQDDDDVSAPTRLGRQVEYLDRHQNAVLCATWACFVEPDRGAQFEFKIPDNPRLLKVYLERGHNPLVHGSVMFRSTAYNSLPVGYRLSNPAQDYDLWLRLLSFGDLGMLESIEYFYQLSIRGISFSTYTARHDIVKYILQLHEERKRYGCEVSSEVDLHERQLVTKNAVKSANVIDYSRGLRALQLGRYDEYRHFMREAAREGALARMAKLHLRLGFLAPLTRIFYWARRLRTPFRYLRPVEPGHAVLDFTGG